MITPRQKHTAFCLASRCYWPQHEPNVNNYEWKVIEYIWPDKKSVMYYKLLHPGEYIKGEGTDLNYFVWAVIMEEKDGNMKRGILKLHFCMTTIFLTLQSSKTYFKLLKWNILPPVP